MASVLIALGSNYHQCAYMWWATQRLGALLSVDAMSPVLWTPDIHGHGLWYMNRLIRAKTMLPLAQLNEILKQIERESHRSKERVTIDLDLMQYDVERYHLADWERPYIQLLIGFV